MPICQSRSPYVEACTLMASNVISIGIISDGAHSGGNCGDEENARRGIYGDQGSEKFQEDF